MSEFELLKKDWKAFSKSRGYSEEDIEEYQDWLIYSGRRDFNDALWLYENIDTLGLIGHIKNLYCRFIEFARSKKIKLNKEVLKSYEEIKKELIDNVI